MSLHPIRELNRVIEEYKEYLRTEFRAKDERLRAALDLELERPLFLSQEPFFQAHRPFRNGKSWRDLPLDPKLSRAMEERAKVKFSFIHQTNAIEELVSPNPRPVVVTTGTGSGKTEAFLLPVIQNAIEDIALFGRKPGLTSILVYPMNALANDQLDRIVKILDTSGFKGAISVEKYDRGTKQADRERMRRTPPHIILTNYMMLEYLLVRPADREDIFANHRCRFIVLDEVHTYRGALGSNIALLIRRLRNHLGSARQDWMTDVPAEQRERRYPSLVPIGTSATIKRAEVVDGDPLEAIRLRDQAVQEFFGRLTGVDPPSIRVFGEEIEEIKTPAEAVYAPTPALFSPGEVKVSDSESVRKALCRLSGALEATPIAEAARRCRILWDLNHWLVGSPMSIGEIVERIRKEVQARAGTAVEDIRKEVEATLIAGAALPDDVPGALRLKSHLIIRGGWQFHRCVNPACGRLYPMGEEQCECGFHTAPLYICRNCGADYLRFVCEEPLQEPLRPSAVVSEGPEWVLFEPGKFLEPGGIDEESEGEEEEEPPAPRRRGRRQPETQGVKRQEMDGSFDPRTLSFSLNADDHPIKAKLLPKRSVCACCGGRSGIRSVITPIALGTSAALKVVTEGILEALSIANADRPGHDGKERLLIFSDNRQDAAHQARFIHFASRFDRMRRRVVEILEREGPVSLQRIVELLGDSAVTNRDNPFVPANTGAYIHPEVKKQIRIWEEAPLLDNLAVSAGYRASLFNTGAVGIRYEGLGEYVIEHGRDLAASLGISPKDLHFICQCLLDEMRVRTALSRDLLRYYPSHPSFPSYLEDAKWERKIKRPTGYPCTAEGVPIGNIDQDEVPSGIKVYSFWRREGAGGREPKMERILRRLLNVFGGIEPTVRSLTDIVSFLRMGSFITQAVLYGAREQRGLLQVNAQILYLGILSESERLHCGVCGFPRPYFVPGLPCPLCRGSLVVWPDAEVNRDRNVRRIRSENFVPLFAGEHTAQITTGNREKLEEEFKAAPEQSKMNVIACSPTMELGIDIGGLDAIALRNMPPRPDNYAQRGGRAGRRSRVGFVVGYARSTPHDQYFYDNPAEMISGEIPVPLLALGNRDVILRHANAIVFSATTPGLAGRMINYVSVMGEVNAETVNELVEALRLQFEYGVRTVRDAFGDTVLTEAGLTEEVLLQHFNALPDKVRDVFDRTARQVIDLRQALDRMWGELEGRRAGIRSMELIARLLGKPVEGRPVGADADDRSAGHPMRRFAEFGILPGYEFPTEPSSLRLKGDPNEEDPITVDRRFGISQYRPGSQVFARTKKWKVDGLDLSSPWNPRAEGPNWIYRVCRQCDLRYFADSPLCPRCRHSEVGDGIPACEYAGFTARVDESPILDEEERFATRNLVRLYPQWNGDVVGRWSAPGDWTLRLSAREEIRWLNEGPIPKAKELQAGITRLHEGGKGHLLCATCGGILTPQFATPQRTRGRRQARGAADQPDPFGHRRGCANAGTPPTAVALVAACRTDVLRLLVPVPQDDQTPVEQWGLSLGYALRIGMRHHFMLDGAEIDFEMEGPWETTIGEASEVRLVSLSFIDPSIGGTGYLRKAAEEFHLVARRAIGHLDHPDCTTACYRCLKSYANQRVHDRLRWPLALPYLDMLASAPPTQRPGLLGDIEDPRPWLDAYAAGVGSPLELKFLRLFERHEFNPVKQHPISRVEGGKPITVADFAVPEKRVAIYVDSAAFHVGENLRRDRVIRAQLRSFTPPWTVVELRVTDLGRGSALVEDLKEKTK